MIEKRGDSPFFSSGRCGPEVGAPLEGSDPESANGRQVGEMGVSRRPLISALHRAASLALRHFLCK